MSIFSSLQPSPSVSRNAFDLSQRHVFSAKFGPIKPVCCIDTIPGSHYEIDIQQLLRSQPLQTAAFTGFKINYDVIFTPYNFLNHNFNQMIAGRGHNVSNLYGDSSTVPTFRLSSFGCCIAICAAFERFYNFIWNSSLTDERNNEDSSYFFLISSLAPSYSCLESALVNLDMLGYGNFTPISDWVYRSLLSRFESNLTYDSVLNALRNSPSAQWPQGVDSDLLSTYFAAAIEDFFDNFSSSVVSLNMFQNFRLENIAPSVFTDILNDKREFSMLRILAYNKCFESFYRSNYYTSSYKFINRTLGGFVSYDYDLSSFSSLDFDFSGNLTFVESGNVYSFSYDSYSLIYVVCLLSLKSHLYKRDMFTGVLPSTQFGNVSVVNAESSLKFITNQVTGQSGTTLVLPSGRLSSSVGNSSWIISPSDAFSILSLRRADALQRFRERMLRAGDDVRSVFEAHGWPMPSSQMSELPIFLGSFDGNFDINTVAATTESADIELGQLGANGVGTVSGKKIYFDCKDFGVIMVLFHLTKSAEYDSLGVDYANTLIEQFDFPFPEFQNISLSPVSDEFLNVYNQPRILGYLPTSYGYKTAVDKVHGAFYSSFSPYIETENIPSGYSFNLDGVFSNFVVPKYDIVNSQSNEEFLYEDIHAIDNIFAQSADGSQDTDHFLINCYVDVKAVLPLPVIGLPV